jgi:hypothetical protein
MERRIRQTGEPCRRQPIDTGMHQKFMSVRHVSLLGLVLAATISVLAQGTVDQNGVYRLTEEEIARNKRLAELLRHPKDITLRLVTTGREVPKESPMDRPAPYNLKDHIGLQLFITQNSSEEISLGNLRWPYYEYRPELTRNGDLVSYSAAAQEKVQRAESEPPSGGVISYKLVPGREDRWAFVNLMDWYDPLVAGYYKLTIRKQFAWDGDWVVSNPVYFEVQPRPPASPILGGITVELTPDVPNSKMAGKRFRFEDEVAFAVVVVNNSDQPVEVSVIDRFYGNRPQLFKDGVLVPYRPQTETLLKSKEESPSLVEIVNPLILDPGTRSALHGISMKDWYGPLKPGRYRLIDRRRFEIDGPWTVDSEAITFEVLPAKLK